jgi:agmatine/peptidylarginine deiminase
MGRDASSRVGNQPHARPRWPATEDQWREQVTEAERKYRPLVRNLTAPELVGLLNVANETMDVFEAELKADTTRTMQQRSIHIGRRA